MATDRDALKRGLADAHIKAAAVLRVFDEELARPLDQDAPAATPVTIETVEAEMALYREALVLTEQQIERLTLDLREMDRVGPYDRIEPTEDTLSELAKERTLLETDLRKLEAMRDRLSRPAS